MRFVRFSCVRHSVGIPIHQLQHLFWLLKRTFSLRWLFWTPTTYGFVYKYENQFSITQIDWLNFLASTWINYPIHHFKHMCFGCSRELSHWDGSFEHPQHVFLFINKKNSFNNTRLSSGLIQCGPQETVLSRSIQPPDLPIRTLRKITVSQEKISTKLLTTYFKRKMSVSVLFEFSEYNLYIKSANLVKNNESIIINFSNFKVLGDWNFQRGRNLILLLLKKSQLNK